MATPVMVRTKESSTKSTGSSTNTPIVNLVPEKLSTEVQSGSLMKRLLAASISTVCYLRNIFPDDCFEDKKLPNKGLVKLLTNGGGPNGKANHGAVRLLTILHGVFDSLEKKYLRELIFGIACDPNRPDVVHEAYSFKVEYGEDGQSSFTVTNAKGKSVTVSEVATKQMVDQVMRKLALTIDNLDPLPIKEPQLLIKLLYYDERTPAGYDPPEFMPAEGGDLQFAYELQEMKFGAVATKFHRMKFGARSLLCPQDDSADHQGNQENMEVENDAPEV